MCGMPQKSGMNDLNRRYEVGVVEDETPRIGKKGSLCKNVIQGGQNLVNRVKGEEGVAWFLYIG